MRVRKGRELGSDTLIPNSLMDRDHLEKPDRAQGIYDMLLARGLAQRCVHLPVRPLIATTIPFH